MVRRKSTAPLSATSDDVATMQPVVSANSSPPAAADTGAREGLSGPSPASVEESTVHEPAEPAPSAAPDAGGAASESATADVASPSVAVAGPEGNAPSPGAAGAVGAVEFHPTPPEPGASVAADASTAASSVEAGRVTTAVDASPPPQAAPDAAVVDASGAGLPAVVVPVERVPDAPGIDRLNAARALVQTHTLVSAGAGFLPGIGVDVAAMSASQLWLLRRLSAVYGVEFREDLARKLVAAALAGFVPLQVVSPIAGLFKAVPVVGQMLGGLSMAAAGGAITYAIGMAFVQHFESGGTLLTFDPRRVRSHFAAEQAREAAGGHGR